MQILRYIFFVCALLLLQASASNAQWSKIKGSVGGIRCFAVSGENLFAGTGDGVFRFSNSGKSWTAVNKGLPSSNDTFVQALAVSGTNIFAGIVWNSENDAKNGDSGVFLSTNNGKSWTAVNNGLTNTMVYSLAVYGTNIFAGTWGSGVFRSNNNGKSWTAASNGLPEIVVFALAFSDTNLFAGSPIGVYRVSDDNKSWIQANSGLTKTFIWSLAVSGTNLFAGTDGGVFLSTNNGKSWTAVNKGLPLNDSFVGDIAVSGTNIFAGTSKSGVFLSTNNGKSWTAVNTKLTNRDITALAVSDTNIFAGTSSGVWTRPLSEMIKPDFTQTANSQTMKKSQKKEILWDFRKDETKTQKYSKAETSIVLTYLLGNRRNPDLGITSRVSGSFTKANTNETLYYVSGCEEDEGFTTNDNCSHASWYNAGWIAIYDGTTPKMKIKAALGYGIARITDINKDGINEFLSLSGYTGMGVSLESAALGQIVNGKYKEIEIFSDAYQYTCLVQEKSRRFVIATVISYVPSLNGTPTFSKEYFQTSAK